MPVAQSMHSYDTNDENQARDVGLPVMAAMVVVAMSVAARLGIECLDSRGA